MTRIGVRGFLHLKITNAVVDPVYGVTRRIVAGFNFYDKGIKRNAASAQLTWRTGTEIISYRRQRREDLDLLHRLL